MLLLDRTTFHTSKIFEQRKDSAPYKNVSVFEKQGAFAYLQSVAFNYPLRQTPKMDKTVFSTRKLNG